MKISSKLATIRPNLNVLNTNQLWLRQFGSSDFDAGMGIVADGSGGIYSVGSTYGSLASSNLGANDVFLAKYDRQGKQIWVRQFGSRELDVVKGITADGAGFVYLTGYTFGNLPGNSSSGNRDVFIAKYSSDGNLIWLKQFGSSSADESNHIAQNSKGDIFVAGGTYGNLQTNINPLSEDAFIAKYDANGNRIWVRQFGTSKADSVRGISTDSNGNIYATGSSGNEFAADGSHDIFIVKYSDSGNQLWLQNLSSTADDYSTGMVSFAGNSYIVGYSKGSLPGNRNLGNEDAFIAKYDANGVRVWVQQFGSAETEQANAIAYDNTGNLYVTGLTYGGLGSNTNLGSSDGFLAKYDGNGRQIWVRQFGTPSIDEANSITIDSNGNLFVSGYTYGTLSGNTNSGFSDAFIVGFDRDGNLLNIGTSQPTNLAISATTATQTEGNSGTKAFTFTVTRSGSITGSNTVNWTVSGSGSSPTNGADFGGSFPAGTVTFAPGETTKNISINVSGDTISEANEGFTITLSNASNGAIITTATATGTIQNDDTSVNRAPTNLTLSNSSIPETLPVNWAFATFSTTDPDTNDSFTYSLVSGTGGTDNNRFTIQGNQLRTATGFDFETKRTHSIRVRTTDRGGLFFEKVFTVNITNINETPTHISLSNDRINENQPIGTVIGNFMAFDPDGDTPLTYRFISGGGLLWDNALFSIENNQLKSQRVFNFEAKNTYSIQVRVTDPQGLFYDKAFSIKILDVPEQTNLAITNNSATSATQLEGNSGNRTFLFTVTRSGLITGSNTVNWAVTGTPGVNAADFGGSLPGGTITFAPGETTKIITINVSGDTTFEADESFNLTLSNASNGAVITTATATATVLNDDTSANKPFIRQFGTSDSDTAREINTDNNGNIYVVYNSSFVDTSGLVKYDAKGNPLWTKILNNITNDIVVDANANIYAVRGSYLDKYGTNGNLLWSKQISSTSSSFSLRQITINNLGNIYVMDGNSILKYDLSGNQSWSKQLSGFNLKKINTDRSGNIYVTGESDNGLAPGGIVRDLDVLVSKLDTNGNTLWSRSLASLNQGKDEVSGIATDVNGNVYVTGSTFRASLPGNSSLGIWDAFITKYDALGNRLWVRQFGTSDIDSTTGITISSDGSIYIAGNTNGNLPGVAGLPGYSQPGVSDKDGFVAKYDTNGNQIWLKQFGGPSTSTSEEVSAITVDNQGKIYITGGTYGSLPINTNLGGQDAFIIGFDSTGNLVNLPNQAPSNLTLSNSNIAENLPIASVVGNLISTDYDGSNTFTYSLVAGTGSTDNARFTIQNNQLRTNAVLDFETKNTYTIRVRTTDEGGLFYEKALTINLININEINGDSGNNNLAGTAGNDFIDGKSGNDTLNGWQGNDTLTGGAGSDRFILYSTLVGIDTITDFNPVDDTIALSAFGFGSQSGLIANTNLTPAQFTIGNAATTFEQRVIYDRVTGALWFDTDGKGFRSPTQIASLATGLSLTNLDFFTVA